jgi:hypothetical protein
MKKMNQIALLKKVRQVEAPPFMLTRIEAKLRAIEAERLPVSWQWAGALTFMLLVLFNVSAMRTERTASPDATSQLVESLQLHPSNQLYHE